MMTADLKAEAEKVLIECVDLVQQTCSFAASRDKLIAFALRYAERVEKVERLRGRIEEAEAVMGEFAGTHRGRIDMAEANVKIYIRQLRAELAALELKERDE